MGEFGAQLLWMIIFWLLCFPRWRAFILFLFISLISFAISYRVLFIDIIIFIALSFMCCIFTEYGNKEKYNFWWYDKDWFNTNWRDFRWYDRNWYNKNWLDKEWFNKKWRNIYKINKYTWTKYDSNWYDYNWINNEWFDKEWWYTLNFWPYEYWYNKFTKSFFKDWKDIAWFDERWFKFPWYNKYTWTKFDTEWFDYYWFNEKWYDKNWYDKDWKDITWFNKEWRKKIIKDNQYDIFPGERYNKSIWDKYRLIFRFFNYKKEERELNYKKKWGYEFKSKFEYERFIRELVLSEWEEICSSKYLNINDINNKQLYENDIIKIFDKGFYFVFYNTKEKDYYLKNIRVFNEELVHISKLTPAWFEIEWNIFDINSLIQKEISYYFKYFNYFKDSLKLCINKIIDNKNREKEKQYKSKKNNYRINVKWDVQICSIASGSNWNCYYIWDDNEWILVDNWISYKMLTSRLNEVNIDLNTIKWVFITHEHSDHIKWLWTFYKNNPDIPIYFNSEAFNWVKPEYSYEYKDWIVDINLKTVELWWFKIHPFKKVHDTNFPISYRIEFKWKNIWVFTDIWKVNKEFENQFSKCDAVFLESNHDRQMLRDSRNYPDDLKNRIRKNHLSNDEAYDLIMDHAKENLKIVILSHISNESNSSDKLNEIFWDLKNKYKIGIASRERVWEIFEL